MNFRRPITSLTILTLCPYFLSCNVHSRFTLYREQQSRILPTDGFYFQRNESRELPLVFFLYKDGTVMTSGKYVTHGETVNPKTIAEFWYERSWKTNGKMQRHIVTIDWDQESGHYQSRGDSIKIQYFWFQTQMLIQRNVIELRGIVKNDSTIQVTQKRTYGAKKQNSSKLKYSKDIVFDKPITLTFHKFNDHRPDSSRVWFKQRKWYREK